MASTNRRRGLRAPRRGELIRRNLRRLDLPPRETRNVAGPWRHGVRPIIDPRRGDIEDDASSTKRRSLLSLAGSLLAEISLPKLLTPGCADRSAEPDAGRAPIVASIWFNKISGQVRILAAERLVGDRSSWLVSRSVGSEAAVYFDWRRVASGRSIRSPFNPAIRSAARRCATSREATPRAGRPASSLLLPPPHWYPAC